MSRCLAFALALGKASSDQLQNALTDVCCNIVLNQQIDLETSVEEIRQFVGADSLGFLSEEGLLKSVSGSKEKYCMGCFTGSYPIPVQLEMDKMVLET